jgi:outer membrane protein
MRPSAVLVIGVAGLLSLAVARPAQAQEPRAVTLADAMQLATRNQPGMVQARQDARLADAQQRQATAAFLPSLTSSLASSRNGGSRANQFGVPTSVESYYSSSLRLSASWDLFTGFRRGAQRTSANATSDQRDATLRRQEYATILATQQAFFLALADAELVNVQQTRLRSADEQLKLTSERLRLGATTRSDSLRARVAYGNAQIAVINAQNNLRNAQAALARQIQVDGLVAPVADSSLFTRLGPLDTATLLRDALRGAPSVREADAALVSADAQKKISRAAYMPSVSLSAGNTWLAGNNTINVRDSTGAIISSIPPTGKPFGGHYVSGWNVGVTISMPIFNNLTRETNAISADAGFQAAEARARDARLALSASLIQYLSALDAAAARIDVGAVSVVAAQEDLRMQTERYRLGAVTIIEVLQSQANLDQAQVDLVQARYDYLVARAQIEALVGHRL